MEKAKKTGIFAPEASVPYPGQDGCFLSLPHVSGMDGFFIAAIEKTMKWLKIPLFALVCAAVFVFSAWFTIKVLLTDESTVTCPDLTGLDVEEAKQLAVQKGLSFISGKV